MNRLKFKGSDQFYTGEVTPIGRNKVSIEFVGGIPKGIDTSLIEAFTPGGVKFLELTGSGCKSGSLKRWLCFCG